MDPNIAEELQDLPEVSRVAVTTFVAAAREVFRDDLRSVVLYGSGAEGRLRPTSDINLVLVLSAFDHAKATAIRSQFSYAESAVRLTAMFLLESELTSAIELFAQKFADGDYPPMEHLLAQLNRARVALKRGRASISTRSTLLPLCTQWNARAVGGFNG